MLARMRATLLLSLLLALPAATLAGEAPADPLAAEIDRWSELLARAPADGPWAEARTGLQPALDDARAALRADRRLLALYRLSRAQEDLAATAYVAGRTLADRQSLAAFEAEWTARQAEMGKPLQVGDLRPALLRALAETAAAQSPVYARASLDYARSTTAESGYYYLGAAIAGRELAALGQRLSLASAGTPPALRDLQPDIDALRGELLAAYRPPASLDRHREFIAASSALKEASELNAAGRRHAALLRYLVGAQRVGPLIAQEAPAPQSLQEWQRQLADPGVDHSIGRLFLEMAEEGDAHVVDSVVRHVMPRYAHALQPAPVLPAPQSAGVRVTLVRWPYT
jgi:hypothetical protein